MNHKRTLALMFLLFLIAMCARLLPLQSSHLPYNIDGFPLARISDIILDTQRLPDPELYGGLLSYNMKLPVFSAVLATFSSVLGVEPLYLLPYFCALIGSLAVVFIYVLALKLTGSEVAGFGAGIFAALTGLFVYVTTAAMKQLLAITLLCFILYLYTQRKDWRHRFILVFALVILPFIHHLTTLIALLVLSFALVGTAFRRSEHHVRSLKEFILDILIGPGILLLSIAYYQVVHLEIASQVLNANDAMLLASIVILMAVIARMLSMTVQTKPWFFIKRKEDGITLACILDEKVLVLIIGIAALYINSRVHLFTGGTLTSGTLLKLMFPYLMLAVVGTIGFNVIRYSGFSNRHLIVGLFIAPFTMILFSSLRGLDLFGFMIAYRSYNFIDIPLAIAAGVGLAYIIGRLMLASKQHGFYKPVVTFSIVLFVLLCAAALPLAYNNEEAFGVREVTSEYEFNALTWVSNAGLIEVTTDQRYGDIIGPYYEVAVDKSGPWLMKSGGLRENDVVITCHDWTEVGAQMYPFSNVVFTPEELDILFYGHNVVYTGGPEGREMVIAIVR